MSEWNIYQEFTDKIINVLDKVDPADLEVPFAVLAVLGLPRNPVTDHSYQGINIASLWFDQEKRGSASNEWATFKQWRGHGASVRKGENGSPIIFYKALEHKGENERSEKETTTTPVLRYYTVLNAVRVHGYEAP